MLAESTRYVCDEVWVKFSQGGAEDVLFDTAEEVRVKDGGVGHQFRLHAHHHVVWGVYVPFTATE